MESVKKCLEPNCTNKVEKGRTKCDRHRRMKQKLEREKFSIEELLEQADEKIEQFITPLVENSRKFYVGLTGNFKSRKNDHKKDSKTCEMTEIFKAKNRDEAILMEAIMIHKLIFHGDANYRKFCCNASGGGRVPESKNVDDFCIYILCDENPDATPGIKNKNMLFCDGNLSSVEIEKCVKIIIETKVLNHVQNDKKVKFGYSRNGNFQKRMSDYDYDKKINMKKHQIMMNIF
ncbi:hypothetical protein PVAND_017862 [Polypedilum vanderplanki]|uniref:Uncharacterized protein n=1 Tax=Polypedilum vanderplanki TaxID=319348 RepID=A0A9J6B9H3_POLVA|nr:hypothetical protein PVAND_017862 [Polypedilum vanderplanki]